MRYILYIHNIMKCPVCQSVALNERHQENHLLHTSFCDACHGNWLPQSELDKLRGETEAILSPGWSKATPHIVDTPRVLFCPHDGNIMVKYRVGITSDFYFDHCPDCSGTWFDRHEWAFLCSKGLRRELLRIFPDMWVKEQELHEEVVALSSRRETLLQTLLSDDEYGEIARLRDWLDVHPNRRDVLSVLLSGNREMISAQLQVAD